MEETEKCYSNCGGCVIVPQPLFVIFISCISHHTQSSLPYSHLPQAQTLSTIPRHADHNLSIAALILPKTNFHTTPHRRMNETVSSLPASRSGNRQRTKIGMVHLSCQ